MKRALSLLLLLMVAAACKGSGGGSAQLSGSVLDTNGTPIAGAAIVAGGVSGASAADGSFNLINVASGTVPLSVTAAGFYPLQTNLPVAPGVNNADFTLETCIVGTANCTATPTPTVTASGTPTPGTFNVTANFTGIITDNINNSPQWTGSASLTGSVKNVTIGDHGNGGQNTAQALCVDAGGTLITNPPTASDICGVIWFGKGAGTNNNDADLELHLRGDLWQTGFTQIQPGTIDLLYFENQQGGQGNFTELAAASSGQFVLVSNGYQNPQPAELDGGYFNIPNLP